MIYLDHNATTPLDERVLDAMLPYLRTCYGNPSGLYRLGRLSRGAIDCAREQVAALVDAKASEVIFTSGGTEANNLGLKGMAWSLEPGTIVTGSTEHPAVSEPLGWLAGRGWFVRPLPVDREGQPDLDDVGASGVADWKLGALMLANNETGVIHDTARLSTILRERGGFLHVDAVQAAGKIPVSFAETGAHTLSVSAHKLGGPKGIGALIANRATPITPLVHGGGQEQGRRGGTENVAGIVGFGKAAELSLVELQDRATKTRALQQYLENRLRQLPGLTIFGDSSPRLPNTIQFSIRGHQGETLVMYLDRKGIAVSSGSACASGGNEPSPVLTAMGIPEDMARGALRVSLGPGNTELEMDAFMNALAHIVSANSGLPSC